MIFVPLPFSVPLLSRLLVFISIEPHLTSKRHLQLTSSVDRCRQVLATVEPLCHPSATRSTSICCRFVCHPRNAHRRCTLENQSFVVAPTSSGVSEVTLRFWGVTASVVGANSPLFGWIRLNVELNKDFSYSSGKGFLTTGPQTETGNVLKFVVGIPVMELCRGGTKSSETSCVDCVYAVELCWVTVSFIYGIAYLTGTVSFEITRLICILRDHETDMCILRDHYTDMCNGMGRGRPARGKKAICSDLSLVRKVGSLHSVILSSYVSMSTTITDIIFKISTFSRKNYERSSFFKVSYESIAQHPSCMSTYWDLFHNLASSDKCIVANVTLSSSMTVIMALKYCSRSNMKFSKAFASLAPQKGFGSEIFTLLTKILPPAGA
ncbi:hypothetical protein E5676_scaffold190G00240 [Cucumis melo var. makuwa]|uniref:Uncharacterized protein n=1 Tax=Cucumis melo var. makuwa TaxID=1194695 RepID=A0A5D3DRD9_CUCMM|nr:hypothetical protein E6C27_scaffold1164G00140 [Cucumis melo var. makuwa]TYK25929.1 hypothetical protein E5676_scaffold190G00240 [Cucumis melo var. makuwa]